MMIKWSNDIIQRKTKQTTKSNDAIVTINKTAIIVNGTAYSRLVNPSYLAIGVDDKDHLVIANTNNAKTYTLRCLDLDRYAFGPLSMCNYLLDTYDIRSGQQFICTTELEDEDILLVTVDPLPRRKEDD